MRLISSLFNFVRLTTSIYDIDESHGISHSMDVFLKSNEIYNKEVCNYPHLWSQKRIIYTAAILHDMCDRKYMDKDEGLSRIQTFLQDKFSTRDIDVILAIISTMSYSYVKRYGYPYLNQYQMAYHIVREADLLAGYDVNRGIIYDMYVNNKTIVDSYLDTSELFERRMFKHFDDELFITKYSKNLAKKYEIDSYDKLKDWNHVIQHF